MSLPYVDDVALQENIVKTKEAIETARAGLDAKKADVFQVTTMPQTPTEGQCVQYLGTTTVNYTYGSWYQYQEITPSTDPKTYHWVEVTQPVIMDSTLDNTSTNGIQNQAVTNALQALQNGVVIIYANESALPSLVNYAGGIILAVGSVAFCVAEKTWHKVTAINPSSLAITWSAYNPNIALEEASTLPTASVDLLNKCYLYIGATTSTLDKGKIYQCQAVEVVPEGTEDPSALGWYELVGTTYELSADTSVDSSKTYYEIKWVSISSANLVAGKGITIEGNTINADTNIFPGTLDEWEALTPAEQENYDFVASPDEASEDIADAVTDGDMRPVTSNAVYDQLQTKLATNTTEQGPITSQSVSYRKFTLTDTYNISHGYQPHILFLISREEVIMLNVRIHSTDISVEATSLTKTHNINSLSYTTDGSNHSITIYATLNTWAMSFSVQKITIQNVQPTTPEVITEIPSGTTSLTINKITFA